MNLIKKKQEQLTKQRERKAAQQRKRIETRKEQNRKKSKPSNRDEDDDNSSMSTTPSQDSTNQQANSSLATSTTDPPRIYGVEKGLKVQAVMGVNNDNDKLSYIIRYHQADSSLDDKMESVPQSVAHQYCSEEIISFFQSRIAWKKHPKDSV